jgi:hypothetical protein
MAEKALYGNVAEPSFPFEHIVPRLSWLPDYLSAVYEAYDPKKAVETLFPLLNTVLVFTRARTSALYHIKYLVACRKLAYLLNAELEGLGQQALYHRVEIVRRGRSLFFITCKNSPRFNWRTHLTHLDVGRNLDYSAAGEIFAPPYPPRGVHQFIERTSMLPIIVDIVSLEALKNQSYSEESHRFNEAKQELFNDVMRRLALPYRFKWVLVTPKRAENAVPIMMNNTPPSREWWEENCVFADGVGIRDFIGWLPQFCSFDCKFDKYWPMIQYMYNFVRVYYGEGYEDKRYIREYWDVGAKALKETQRVLKLDMTADEFESFFKKIKEELDELLNGRESYLKPNRAKKSPPSHSRKDMIHKFRGRVTYPLRLFWQEANLRSFERWKLREPLVYNTAIKPSESMCDELLF